MRKKIFSTSYFASALLRQSSLTCETSHCAEDTLNADTAKKYFPPYASLFIHENLPECMPPVMHGATLHRMRHLVGIILFFPMVGGGRTARETAIRHADSRKTVIYFAAVEEDIE